MAKHEKTFVNLDKPYEQNLIGLRGIIVFAAGLFLLCVITFGLMYVLQNVLEDQAKEADKVNQNPMTKDMKRSDFLPPEPRLQAAPGFGVDSPNGRVNLELKKPQSEYDELHRQWEELWKDGQKDAKTGTVVTLPIEEAKAKLLEQNVKAVTGEQGQKSLEEATMFVSGSSAGRTTSDRRR
jgi:hypothetical protein